MRYSAPSYEEFKQMLVTLGYAAASDAMFFHQPVDGVSFSIRAVLASGQVTVEVDTLTRPETFGQDFPEAVAEDPANAGFSNPPAG